MRRRFSNAIRRSPARARRASVLVIVMITLLFATFALVAFMEKASVDLIVDQREALTRRLRAEAYSALEMTLGVLTDFREVNQGLHSPAEGWDNPLEFAGYTPGDDRKIDIRFEDESGKISLPRADAQVLATLFQNWGIIKTDAETLADAMLGWMHRNHVYTSGLPLNYDSGSIPYETPGRSLRSFEELAAIEKVREVFYDRDGRPNDYYRRFVENVSLFDFARPNINGGRPDAMAALGQFDITQQQNLSDYLKGAGTFQSQGPQFFNSPADAQRIAGPNGNTGAFGTTISALRITVIVHEGKTDYKLSTVVAPPGGATPILTTATATRTQTSGSAAQTTAQQQQQRPNNQQASAPQPTTSSNQQNPATRNLKYPFALLEVRENDEIPALPAPAPTP